MAAMKVVNGKRTIELTIAEIMRWGALVVLIAGFVGAVFTAGGQAVALRAELASKADKVAVDSLGRLYRDVWNSLRKLDGTPEDVKGIRAMLCSDPKFATNFYCR